MNRHYLISIIMLALMVTFTACQEEDEIASDSSEAQVRSGAPFADPSAENIVAATVNGEKISAVEVDMALRSVVQNYRNSMPPDQIEAMIPLFKQKALEQLVNIKLLAGEAVKEKVTIDESLVEDKFKEIASQFPDEAQFESQMAMAGLTKEKLRNDITQNMKIDKLLKEKVKVEEKVTEEAVSTYYEQNLESFKKPEEVQASHILIAKAQEDTEEAKKEKQDKLSGIRKEIVEGADFAEMATANSDCPSKSNGGDLGFFTRDRMVPPFSAAAFSLEKGGLSGIVETDFGYHLIKTTDKHEARLVPLEEVKEDITNHLNMQNEQKVFEKYIKGLQENGNIEYGIGFEPPQAPPVAEDAQGESK